MNIVYIFDDNYAAVSGVSILSLLENNTKVGEINIYIIDGGISDKNKKRLNNIAAQYNREIVYLTAINPEEMFGIKLHIRTWSYSNFFRLYLDKILPESVDKALYIDSDTLITNEIGSLYDINISNYYIAATYDCAPTPKYDLGLDIVDPYFSDGILLLNIKRIREGNLFSRFKECLKHFDGDISYLEQGVINYVLNKEIKLMPAKYNVMTLSLVFNKVPTIFFSKKDPYYTKEEMISAVEHPSIVHITGHELCIRPWYVDSNHPYKEAWINILNKTDWKDDFEFGKIKASNYNKYIKSINQKYKSLNSICFQLIYGIFSRRMLWLTKYRLISILKK